MKQSEDIKLFVGVMVPDFLFESIKDMQNQLKQSDICAGSYPPPERSHITLQFIGFVNRTKLPAIIEKLQSVQAQPFDVTFDSLDIFEKHHSPSIIFARSMTPELLALAKQISNDLSSLIPKPNQSFEGHLTLMRIQNVTNLPQFKSFIDSFFIPPLSWHVDSFSLIESKVENGQRIYTEIAHFPLK